MWVFPILAFYLFYLNRGTPVPANWAFGGGVRDSFLDWFNQIAFSFLFVLPTSLLGWLILRRHPKHRIGWVLLAAGLAVALGEICEEATIFAFFTKPLSGVWVDILAVVQNFVWVFNFSFLYLLIGIFPSGEAPSGRWRWVIYLILMITLLIIAGSVIESPLSSSFGLPNPLRIDFPGKQTVYNLFFYSGVLGILVAAFAVLGLSIHRYRLAQIEERQQYKWLAVSVFFAVVCIGLGLLLGLVFELTYGQLLVNYSLALIPIGVGIAVMRYRLYDVDLIIRRTLVYAAVTAVLLLVYFGSVALLQGMLSAVSRQRSGISIVISTLAIAALFNPIRRRVQELIDQRFYRSKYDAEQTLAAFSASLREEVGLEQLCTRLIAVVEETIRPERSSLWLRKVPFEGFDELAQAGIEGDQSG
jgi:hypothetical protein